ncbi:MAG TPA: SH3 domain-containing protein [Patescibacteria group bacterium]|nr:SH3 domain-containing protein [Patescibacteria group bacterium]
MIVAIALLLVLAACGDASTSPSTDPAASEGAAPSAAASADPSVAPSSDPGEDGLRIGSWVETAVDGLRVRQEPGTAADSLATLAVGTTATIYDGPVEADGYPWYALAWPGVPSIGGCEENCWAFGWAAAANTDGTPWLTPASPECPGAVSTVAALAAMAPGERLACFGNDELVVQGYLSPQAEGRGCEPGYDHEPVWLGPCPVGFLQATETPFESEGPEMPANVHVQLGACDFGGRSPESCPFVPHIGQWVQVTGHFDDEASSACTIEPVAESAAFMTDAYAAYLCRERFVVTAIEPGES